MNTDHFIALYDMENYIWTMTMASWTPLIIHDSYELQTSMISDHSKWGFIRFTRSMITHDCYEHWLWAITVHRNSYEFGFWTINDQTHHTWWGGINAMKCWCSYMINTDSVSYHDPWAPLPPPHLVLELCIRLGPSVFVWPVKPMKSCMNIRALSTFGIIFHLFYSINTEYHKQVYFDQL